MQGAGAAEAHQGEVARVVALLNRDHAERAEHVLVDDVDDAAGGFEQGHTHLVGDRLHGSARGGSVQFEGAAEQVLGQVAEDDVGVGHRRLCAAAAVGDRPGHRAGRLRPDAQRLGQRRDLRDRAAAGADRLHVERRDADRQVADVGRAHQARLAVLDQRDVGRGAADVEGQDVLQPRRLRDPERPGDAAGRPRHQQRHRLLLGRFRGHQSAVGTQQRDPAAHAEVAKALAQVGDVAADDRAHRGVGDGRQRALVLLHLGQHDVRERDRHVGHHFSGDLRHAFLVPAVDVGIHQRDGQRLDALALQRLQLGTDVGVVDRADFPALRVETALDLDRVLETRHRLGLGPDDPCGEATGHQRAGDLHHLPVALGDDKADARALALEHCVGRDRRAVQEDVDLCRLDPGEAADRLDADDHAFGLIVRRRRRLEAPEAPVRIVEQQEIGERTAHIHTQSIGHLSPAPEHAWKGAFWEAGRACSNAHCALSGR